jgi:DNA-binding response OmpR family regulator
VERKKSILVVDDEPHIVNLVKLTLSDDYIVHEAYSGQEALKILKSVKPDLVLLDLMMPSMDGYQVCLEIRNNPQTKDIPVMILSAKSQIVDKFKSINVGADDYVVKPFEPTDLLRRVQQNLGAIELTKAQ